VGGRERERERESGRVGGRKGGLANCSFHRPHYLMDVEAAAYTGFWWGNLKERVRLGDPGMKGRIILRWIFRKWDVGVWTGSCWLRIGTGAGEL